MAYEKMNCLYETMDDLNARIGGTVCRYKGQAVLVQVASAKQLDLFDCSGRTKLFSIKPNDKEFDISSAEIGYVNYYSTKEENKVRKGYGQAPVDKITVCYLERIPYRRYRQGLSSEVIYTFNLKGAGGIPSANVLMNRGIEESLANKYPTMREAFESIKGGHTKELAISQEVALSKTDAGIILVYFRQKNIGWITPDNPSIAIETGPDSWVYSRVMRRFMNARHF